MNTRGDRRSELRSIARQYRYHVYSPHYAQHVVRPYTRAYSRINSCLVNDCNGNVSSLTAPGRHV